ncbi:hypothetical protein DRO61_08490 [Candidatus Bathyarchaeota archaeon]|nr:MAG: hypothetical protein DRO61_08490 [Candidatus Bathyarchaeota archaeon]
MNNYDKIYQKLNSLIDDVKEITDSHESIIASDDQYEDAEMWWSFPLLDSLEEAKRQMGDS